MKFGIVFFVISKKLCTSKLKISRNKVFHLVFKFGHIGVIVKVYYFTLNAFLLYRPGTYKINKLNVITIRNGIHCIFLGIIRRVFFVHVCCHIGHIANIFSWNVLVLLYLKIDWANFKVKKKNTIYLKIILIRLLQGEIIVEKGKWRREIVLRSTERHQSTINQFLLY